MLFVASQLCRFSSGRPASFQPITASSVGTSSRYQYSRRYSENPSSMPLMSPHLSQFSFGPFMLVRISPPYSLAMYAWYEVGSAQMLAPVTELLGATVGSVHAAAARSVRAATGSALPILMFIGLRPPLEADAQPTREGARARVDVVVDALQPRRGVHALVAGDREGGLNGQVAAPRPAAHLPAVAQRDVVHPEERRLLDVVVRPVLRRL